MGTVLSILHIYLNIWVRRHDIAALIKMELQTQINMLHLKALAEPLEIIHTKCLFISFSRISSKPIAIANSSLLRQSLLCHHSFICKCISQFAPFTSLWFICTAINAIIRICMWIAMTALSWWLNKLNRHTFTSSLSGFPLRFYCSHSQPGAVFHWVSAPVFVGVLLVFWMGTDVKDVLFQRFFVPFGLITLKFIIKLWVGKMLKLIYVTDKAIFRCSCWYFQETYTNRVVFITFTFFSIYPLHLFIHWFTNTPIYHTCLSSHPSVRLHKLSIHPSLHPDPSLHPTFHQSIHPSVLYRVILQSINSCIHL